MRRLLSLVSILLLLALGLAGALPAGAQGGDDGERSPSPSPAPSPSPTTSSSPSPSPTSNGTQTPDDPPENETTEPDNTTAPDRTENGTTGAEPSYNETLQRYRAAWERYNQTRIDEAQARAVYEDSARRCKDAVEADRDAACATMRRDEETWRQARDRMEQARAAYSEAREAYEEAREDRMEAAQGPRPPRRCRDGERATDDGKCVRDKRPEPSPSARAARQEAYQEWQRSRETTEAEHQQHLERVPPDARRDLATCQTTGTRIVCRYVTFAVDPAANGLRDVAIGGAVVFESIVFPGPPDAGKDGHGANLVRIEGEGWRFLLSDGPAAPMHLRGDAEHPFLLTLGPEVRVEETATGYQLTVPVGDSHILATVGGKVSRDAVDDRTMVVHGDARFVVQGRSAVMARLAEEGRGPMQAALDRGRVGAEVTVLKADDGKGRKPTPVVGETILYHDMRIDLVEGPVLDAPPADRRVYTVTVDAESHEGRTIALRFEEGLLDPASVAFRYFDVADDGTTTEAVIIQASSLADVLDPGDDGTVSEWWVVRDGADAQVLVSIPGFSVHKIELMSLDFVLKEPSLVLGLAGAAAVVTIGLIALFRRPEED